MRPVAPDGWQRLIAAAYPPRHSFVGTGSTTRPFAGGGSARAKTKTSPAFVQVELPAAPDGVTIELGVHARVQIHSTAQIQLAARLLLAFNAKTAC